MKINMDKFIKGQNGSHYYHKWDQSVLDAFGKPEMDMMGRNFELVEIHAPHRRSNLWKIYFSEDGIRADIVGKTEKVDVKEVSLVAEYVFNFIGRLFENGFLISEHSDQSGADMRGDTDAE